MSVFGVILVRIQSECREIRTRITPNMDTFHTVIDRSESVNLCRLLRFLDVMAALSGWIQGYVGGVGGSSGRVKNLRGSSRSRAFVIYSDTRVSE